MNTSLLGLTPLGAIHTVISLVALAAGTFALIRDHQITLKNSTGRLYVITTVLTCLTGFGIFEHGGFGAPHALGIITLLVLALASVAEKGDLFGRSSAAVAVVSYSATYLFHWIPAITETTTRLPLGAPLIVDREGPELQAVSGILFVLFLIGAFLQVRRLRA